MIEKEDIMVSVYCLAYNHEKYIKDALEGFVMQKTNFKFEVIVHDDASTDGTADVIREYEKKYPDIIKPIYQTENQYSKKIKIVPTYIFPKLRGKYVAVCEGDDYWTDSNKLQIQYDIMERHPECAMCSHYTKWIKMSNGDVGGFFPNKSYNLQEGFVAKDTQFEISTIDLFHINSCLFRKEIYDDYILNKPEYAKLMPVGDIPLLLYFVKQGPLYFVDREMSVYRRGTEGSWTNRVKNTPQKYLVHCNRFIESLELCKDFFEGEYTQSLDEKIKSHKVSVAIIKKDFRFVLAKENRNVVNRMGKKALIKFRICRVFPFLDDVWNFIKRG